jgi:hypothetical protein
MAMARDHSRKTESSRRYRPWIERKRVACRREPSRARQEGARELLVRSSAHRAIRCQGPKRPDDRGRSADTSADIRSQDDRYLRMMLTISLVPLTSFQQAPRTPSAAIAKPKYGVARSSSFSIPSLSGTSPSRKMRAGMSVCTPAGFASVTSLRRDCRERE